ncbi:MAG: hypothetical protein EA399_07655 [Desulfovibrionales bacterium]|nr:MAG: hypothetical protein EA399_07655 [Desulfovibrionales bacterium]
MIFYAASPKKAVPRRTEKGEENKGDVPFSMDKSRQGIEGPAGFAVGNRKTCHYPGAHCQWRAMLLQEHALASDLQNLPPFPS